MTVTRDMVLAVLHLEEPDYERGIRLGQEALPHLAQMVENAESVPSVAAKAVYLAARIGGERATAIVASGAAPSQPRPVRIAAAAGAAFLPPHQRDDVIRLLLDEEDDYGLRKTALRSVRELASPDIIRRLEKIAAEEHDPVFQKLAVEALERQQ